MSIVTGLRFHHQAFGARGILLAAKARLTDSQVETTVKAKGIPHPLHLRVGASDGTIFEQIFVERQYDLDFGRRPATIVDAGANIGLASVFYANKFPEAKIIAIEPDADNFRMLEMNTAPYSHVTPVKAAVWNVDGQMGIDDPGWGTAGFRISEISHIRGEVPAITIETVMKEHAIDYIDLLKIDVEGAEKEIFESDARWIDKVGVIVIELHDRFKAGCSRSVYLATQDFHSEVSWGELSVFSREPYRPITYPR
jgi:FkbM family methyltransferase